MLKGARLVSVITISETNSLVLGKLIVKPHLVVNSMVAIVMPYLVFAVITASSANTAQKAKMPLHLYSNFTQGPHIYLFLQHYMTILKYSNNRVGANTHISASVHWIPRSLQTHQLQKLQLPYYHEGPYLGHHHTQNTIFLQD